MALSSELISQFAKLTKTDEPKSKEETVYGTIVEYNGSKYAKLDGSDLLTPVSSTTNVEEGERVTVMIKNHTATITGNLSSPAARTAEVSAIGTKISDFEIVVADKVDTKQLVAVEAQIDELEAKNVVIEETLTANKASIKELETTKLSSESADLKYANVDFTNIGKAAMEYFYATSGLIENVVVGDQTITGNLVGVTISGDRIEGNTIVAEKLVIKGNDGLYYKLNTDGMNVEAQQTDYNSLNGSIIKAKSITATKISVSDLVAFDATIGGFVITERSLYSGVKESVDNTTRGIYLDRDGQMAVGDANNYIKGYKDSDGSYKLSICADEFVLSTNGKSLEEAISDASGQQMTLSSSRGNIIETERQTLTLAVHVWKGDKEVTSEIPKQAFFWERESGDDMADAEWNVRPDHLRVTEITLTRDEIGKSCLIRCTLSEAGSLGRFVIQDGELIFTTSNIELDDQFSIQNGALLGEDYYYLENGCVKKNVVGNTMSVETSVFDHSVLETSHILVKDEAIDIRSGGSVDIEAGADINLKAGANMTVEADANINLKAGANMSVEADGSIDMKAGSNIKVNAGSELTIESGGKFGLTSGSSMKIESGGTLEIESENFNVSAEGNVTMKDASVSGNLSQDGYSVLTQRHLVISSTEPEASSNTVWVKPLSNVVLTYTHGVANDISFEIYKGGAQLAVNGTPVAATATAYTYTIYIPYRVRKVNGGSPTAVRTITVTLTAGDYVAVMSGTLTNSAGYTGTLSLTTTADFWLGDFSNIDFRMTLTADNTSDDYLYHRITPGTIQLICAAKSSNVTGWTNAEVYVYQ